MTDFTPGGPHGFAIVPAVGKGYTTDRSAKMAVAFNLKTLKTVHRIPVDEDADAVAYDPVSGHVFVIDGDVSHITVIDPKPTTPSPPSTPGSANWNMRRLPAGSST